MTTLYTALSEERARQIAAGDGEALLVGVAATALVWLQIAGLGYKGAWHLVTPAHCAAVPDPQARGLCLAALSMLELLKTSPQGRKTLADLGFEPVEQDREGPRG